MFTNKFFTVLFLAVLFSFGSYLYSQQNQGIECSKVCFIIIDFGDGYSNLEKSLISKFRNSLESKGIFSENDFDIELLMGIKQIEGTNMVAIQITELETLPEESIEAGKKAEIFYSFLDEKKKTELSEEGKFIREYMSGEYLKQFRSIRGNNLVVIDINELDAFVQKTISKYL